MQQPQIRYARTVDGVRIAYYAMGEGPPLFVVSEMQWSHLGHTLGLREYYRTRSGKGLGRGLTIVRYDARGTGLSDRESIDFSWEARRHDVESVMDVLGLREAAFFGHMHAALTAVQFAAEAPRRVTKLILVNPYARGWEHRPMSELAGVAMMPEITSAQWRKYTYAIATLTLGYSSPGLAARIAEFYRDSMSPQSHRAFLDWRETADITPFLKRVRAPTLVIQRQREDIQNLAREVAARIPGARLVSRSESGPIWNLWTDEDTAAAEEFLGIPPAGFRGRHSLTSREIEVLRLIASGLTNRATSRDLVLSERTVARHITNIYGKIGARGKADATAYAIRHNLNKD
jgi:pimeloyl-ACP methyl ester carboxylesterase/DNA-binding CsgD family transcriptional regulator